MKKEIQDFIDYETGIPHQKSLKNFIFTTPIISIPPAIFGIGRIITSSIVLPLMMAIIIWNISLLHNTENKRGLFYLDLGVTSLYSSLMFLLIVYKLLSTIMIISPIYVLISLMIYCIAIAANCFIWLALIKKGSFSKSHGATSLSLILPFSVLGVFLARVTGRYMSQYSVVMTMCVLSLLVSLAFAAGTNNFIKYYYIKLAEREQVLKSQKK